MGFVEYPGILFDVFSNAPTLFKTNHCKWVLFNMKNRVWDDCRSQEGVLVYCEALNKYSLDHDI